MYHIYMLKLILHFMNGYNYLKGELSLKKNYTPKII